MKAIINFFSLLTLCICLLCSCSGPEKNVSPGARSGPYAGSPLPGETPVLFAPGFITTGLYERDVAISPDNNEIYFSVFLGDWTTIMVTKKDGEYWTAPEVASFARDTLVNSCEPAFTPDGQGLLFLCTRPLDGSDPKPGWQDQNIWMVSRDKDQQWTTPEPLPSIINESDQFFPSISKNGMFYFSRTDPETSITSIYQTSWPLVDDKPWKLPEIINGSTDTYNACISPDGSCLVACSTGRDSLALSNKPAYYAFFKNGDTWSTGVNLDSILQLDGGNAISPSFSPDGKYFFFATNKKRGETSFSAGKMNLDFFQERRTYPGNGNSDIYWVEAKVILSKTLQVPR